MTGIRWFAFGVICLGLCGRFRAEGATGDWHGWDGVTVIKRIKLIKAKQLERAMTFLGSGIGDEENDYELEA